MLPPPGIPDQSIRSRPSILFWSILGAAIVWRLLLVFILPLGQTVQWHLEGLNDEPSHYNYVRYLSTFKQFPVQTQSVRAADAFAKNEFEYYQPPAYYVLCAPLKMVSGERTGLYLCRIASFLFGIATILLVWRILKTLGCSQPSCEAGTLFVSILPSHAYFSALVSNDAMSWFCSAGLTLTLLRMVLKPREKLSLRCVQLACLIGIGMLTKSSTIALLPAVVAAVAVAGARARSRTVWLCGVAAIVAGLILAAPWYLRNQHLYGSLMALEIGSGPVQHWLLGPKQALLLVMQTTASFWFPMQHLPSTRLVFIASCAGGLIAGMHTLLAACYLVKRFRALDAHHVVAAVVMLSVLAVYVRFNISWHEAEGRFLLPALGAIAWLFVVPAEAFAQRVIASRPRVPLLWASAIAAFPWLWALLA